MNIADSKCKYYSVCKNKHEDNEIEVCEMYELLKTSGFSCSSYSKWERQEEEEITRGEIESIIDSRGCI